MTDVVLYDYWRSSASYRVRIALNLAGVGYRAVPVNLVAGEQAMEPHLARNPQGYVPALEIDGLLLTQSLAMIDYIDETRGCGFLPDDAAGRARVRALAHLIAMDIHPVCNSNVVARVMDIAGRGAAARAGSAGDGAGGGATGGGAADGEAVRLGWMGHYIGKGMAALERLLDHPSTGRFCHGDRPGLADFCLMPQVYNAERWGVDMSGLGRVRAIRQACDGLPGFQRAHPDTVR